MIAVVDASVAVVLLVDSNALAIDFLLRRYDALAAPTHLDIECLSALRRSRLKGRVSAVEHRQLANGVARLPVTRHPISPLVDRITELSDNASAYDAAYIALAEGLEADLLTADGRLAGVPGVHCRIQNI